MSSDESTERTANAPGGGEDSGVSRRVVEYPAFDALRNGDLDRAVRLATAEIEAGRDDGWASNILFAVAHHSKNRDLALQAIEGAVDLHFRVDLRDALLAQKENLQMNYEGAIKLSQRALEADAENDFALLALGDAFFGNGQFRLAYEAYHELRRRSWGHRCVIRALFGCLQRIEVERYDEGLALYVRAYLDDAETPNDKVESLAWSLVCARYGLYSSSESVSKPLEGEHGFLALALNHFLVVNVEIDRMVRQIRRDLLAAVLQGTHINAGQLQLVCAIANQSFFNEYVFFIDDDEYETLSSLGAVLDNECSSGGAEVKELLPLILTYAMYLPLGQLNCFERIAQFSLDDCEPLIRNLLIAFVHEPRSERVTAESLPTLKPISDCVSEKVRAQYEENPYPRWKQIPIPLKQEGFVQRIAGFFRPISTSNEAPRTIAFPYEGALDVLVAGAGTGEHPLLLASSCPGDSIFALDLSLSSLAYAARKADELGINNLRFVQGDILDIREMGRVFQGIESVGVLHHMSNPMAGVAALKSVLAPKGFLYLGLYSERARATIVAARSYIAEKCIDVSDENLRSIRHRISEGEYFPELVLWRDLHSMSSLRDLLFHVQEHRFNPLQIKEICQENQLEFMGFVGLSREVHRAYRTHFPEDRHRTNLDNWEVFEARFPNTFANMFRFVCQAL